MLLDQLRNPHPFTRGLFIGLLAGVCFTALTIEVCGTRSMNQRLTQAEEKARLAFRQTEQAMRELRRERLLAKSAITSTSPPAAFDFPSMATSSTASPASDAVAETDSR